MKKLKWGILSTARIGVEKVIPGMLKSDLFEVAAISSRNLDRAQHWAKQLNIPKFYGSYEELINDPDIDIIYNPLPNHLHVAWTAKAIDAGKHVLCEKPLFLNPQEADELIGLRDQYKVKVGEAFMVKSHPQWHKAKTIIDSGELGDVLSFHATFSYFNTDPNNIRNIEEYGGGALWDIGCYPVMASRFLFGENPEKVMCTATQDPKFRTDIFSTAIMKFPSGKRATFSVSTQLSPYQIVQVHGSKAEMELLIPFNSPTDRPTCIKINRGDILQENIEKIEMPQCDQYQLQAEDFTRSIIENSPVKVSLGDARDHSIIINALMQSANKDELKKVIY